MKYFIFFIKHLLMCWVILFVGDAHGKSSRLQKLATHAKVLSAMKKPVCCVDAFSAIPLHSECVSAIAKQVDKHGFSVLMSAQADLASCTGGLSVNEEHEVLGDFAVLLASCYRCATIDCATRQKISIRSAESLYKVIELYLKLRSIPLERMLELLDDCLVMYIHVLESYGSGTFANKWDWCKENWWIPAVGIGTCALAVIQWYKTSRFKEVFASHGV